MMIHKLVILQKTIIIKKHVNRNLEAWIDFEVFSFLVFFNLKFITYVIIIVRVGMIPIKIFQVFIAHKTKLMIGKLCQISIYNNDV